MPLKKSIAVELIGDMIHKNLDAIQPREVKLPTDVPKIVSILGPRRAGKTSVCLQLIKELRLSHSQDRLLYVNFEDDRFYPGELPDMDLLLRTYYEMYPDNKSRKVYFFFDEVQEIAGWEKFVRRVFDQENCRIYLTGSSSKLLSREIASALRGRTLSYEVFPLSFSEFMTFNGLTYDLYTSEGKAFLKKHLQAYFWQGGFPELTFLPHSLHLPTINEYINLMLYKDLTERFKVKNPQLLKYLMKYALANIANPMSVNRVFNDLKSQGYALSKNTVYEYLSYLEEAFVLYRTTRWSSSVRKTAINPIKLYGVDQAFKYAMTGRRDEGRIMENMVYMDLRRLGHEPQYVLGRQEVDFLVGERLINVCFEMEASETQQREMNGLNEGMELTGARQSVLVTLHDEDEVNVANGTISIVPLHSFLLKTNDYL